MWVSRKKSSEGNIVGRSDARDLLLNHQWTRMQYNTMGSNLNGLYGKTKINRAKCGVISFSYFKEMSFWSFWNVMLTQWMAIGRPGALGQAAQLPVELGCHFAIEAALTLHRQMAAHYAQEIRQTRETARQELNARVRTIFFMESASVSLTKAWCSKEASQRSILSTSQLKHW